MQFRKINYLTLIYHFFSFNYTLGMYNKFNNEIFYRKAKMNVFFPLFTSLNNLEGRPLHLKKRPFALYYYSLFCRENLRETFLPFNNKQRKGLFVILFRYSNKNNFYLKKRTNKKSCFYSNIFLNFTKKKNQYILNMFIYYNMISLFFFSIKNYLINLNLKIDSLKRNSKMSLNFNKILKKRIRIIILYRKKIIKTKRKSRERNHKSIKRVLYENLKKFKNINSNYVCTRKQNFN